MEIRRRICLVPRARSRRAASAAVVVPASDTPSGLVITLSAKVLKTGLYGMGAGGTSRYEPFPKAAPDLHV